MSAALADPGQQSATTLVGTSYPSIKTGEAVILLVKRMLYAFAEKPEMRDRCLKAYAELFEGGQPHARRPGEEFRAPYFHGPPGHGKTSVCRAAAKIVADKLGLEFLDNPGEEIVPTKKHFYFISQEMSGENSKIEFGGMPAKRTVEGEDGNKVDYMSKLPSERLAKAQFAGAAFLLFDDFANAAPPIQNVALSVTLERRFQGLNLGNVFVGLTGNLGGKDGTYTSANSTALMSRCTNFYLEDDFESFETRMLHKYNDEIADGGILSYLRRNKAHFAAVPDKNGGPFPCPRSWEGAFPVVRSVIHEAKTSGMSVGSYLRLMEAELQGILGMTTGKDFVDHMRSVLSEALPMANDLIEKGKLDDAKFKEKIGSGTKPEQMSFMYQFASAIADNVAAKIIEHEDDFEKAKPYVQNFAVGLFQLQESAVAFTGERLRKRLIYHSKTWYNEQTGGAGGALQPWRAIKTDKAMELQKVLVKDSRASKQAIESMIEALSASRALNLASQRTRPTRQPAAPKP